MATTDTTLNSGQQVEAKTICLSLNIGSFGNRKKASMAAVQVDADKSLLRLTKTLLDSPELQAIKKHDTALAASIRAIAFPSLFKGGIYRLPVGMVATVNDIINAAIERRKALVDAAVAVYPQRVAETVERLGDTANDKDYPSSERFRATFYLEYEYVTFETPLRLKAISPELFNQELQKAKIRLESVASVCEQTMRAGLLKLIEHLNDRLMPTDDGKKKRLDKSAIGHLNDFLATFELRNVTDDAQLGELVEKARGIMKGLDKKTLKQDDLVRQKVQEELTAIQAALDPLVLDKATRVISFDDEVEVA